MYFFIAILCIFLLQNTINTTSYSYVIDIARTLRVFFNFLIKRNPNIKRIKQITRLDIEEYISEINSRGYSPRTVTGYLSIVRTFLEDITRYGWHDCPESILFYSDDFPQEIRTKTRYIDGYILNQLNKRSEEHTTE